ncbi:hypothetical protein [Bremerella alba]|uniref:Uncharacterized protein n=1 Tax=Bremerella alba TaxID=980252 RepID=A0A7V9A951_9BACT|nr:hypothetical protein [Bremerella alba]MBA2116781.1 hypothetical protein [Bremerella alba]
MTNIEITKALLAAMNDVLVGVAIESEVRSVAGSSWHEVDGITGKVRLDWLEEVPEDLEAVGTQLAAEATKAIKQQEVVSGFAVAIEAGYDTGLGFSLKLAEQDQRVLFDYQQRLLRQLSKDPAEVTLADIRPLKGTDDAWHMATVAQIIDAIDGGAGHVESLNGAYAGYEAMLAAGVTDFEVDFT